MNRKAFFSIVCTGAALVCGSGCHRVASFAYNQTLGRVDRAYAEQDRQEVFAEELIISNGSREAVVANLSVITDDLANALAAGNSAASGLRSAKAADEACKKVSDRREEYYEKLEDDELAEWYDAIDVALTPLTVFLSNAQRMNRGQDPALEENLTNLNRIRGRMTAMAGGGNYPYAVTAVSDSR